MKKVLWYSLYLSFYATLWLTFANGVNIYMDRLHNVMTAVYISTNILFATITFSLWVINYAVDKDQKLRSSIQEFSDSEKSKDFMSMSKSGEKWYMQVYLYGTFYPAIFCALILLGYTYLGLAMLFDVLLVAMLRGQVITLKEKTQSLAKKNFSQGENTL